MPFNPPVGPSGPPTASSGFISINPHFQRQEAKTSADEWLILLRKSLALSYNAIRILRHTVVFHLGAVTKIHLHDHSTEPNSPPLAAGRPQPLDFIGCFGKCQLLAPKVLIWRSSLMKEKDEVCIHVPFQWEMLGLGDMSIYRKRKVGGVLLFCFVSLMA